MSKIQAVFLCGGEGTRVKQITGDIPKCVYPINGKPFIFYQMTHLAKSRLIKDFIFCCSDKWKAVRRNIIKTFNGTEADADNLGLSLQFRGLPIHFAIEDEAKGTFAGMMSALPFITTDYVLVMNGDTYCPLDVEALLKFYQSDRFHRMIVTYYFYRHSGIWLMNADFLRDLKDLDYTDREQLLPTGCRIDIPREHCAFVIDYYDVPAFVDIGTPEGIEQAKEVCR